MQSKLLIRILPLAVFALVVVGLGVGLTRDPSGLSADVLLDTDAPEFELPPITGREEGLVTADLKGQVSLVNIFGSWCVACVYEHPVLVQIAEQGGPPIYGVAWNDAPDATARWLDRLGDPYTKVGSDAEGRVAIDFGVTGAPETYVIDPDGVIRYKHIGPITPQDWRRVFRPLITQLETEAGLGP